MEFEVQLEQASGYLIEKIRSTQSGMLETVLAVVFWVDGFIFLTTMLLTGALAFAFWNDSKRISNIWYSRDTSHGNPTKLALPIKSRNVVLIHILSNFLQSLVCVFGYIDYVLPSWISFNYIFDSNMMSLDGLLQINRVVTMISMIYFHIYTFELSFEQTMYKIDEKITKIFDMIILLFIFFYTYVLSYFELSFVRNICFLVSYLLLCFIPIYIVYKSSKTLSLITNENSRNKIVKQTLLMSIISSIFVVLIVIQLLRGLEIWHNHDDDDHNHNDDEEIDDEFDQHHHHDHHSNHQVHIMFDVIFGCILNCMFALYSIITPMCMWLSFKDINDYYYHQYCSTCHLFCVQLHQQKNEHPE